MSGTLAVLTQRFDVLATCVYNKFDYNGLTEVIKREVYSRSIPKAQILSDCAIWKSRIRSVEAALNNLKIPWFEMGNVVGYEYDEVGGPWEIVTATKLPIKYENRSSFVEMVNAEINAYKALTFAIEEYVRQVELSERLETHTEQTMNSHPTFQYIHFSRTPNNLKKLFDELVTKGFISSDTALKDFIANFSGKELTTPPIPWIGASLASLRDFIQLLIDVKLLTKMRRGAPSIIATACFIYPAEPGLMQKLWKQPKYQSKELPLLKSIVQNFQKLSPPVHSGIK